MSYANDPMDQVLEGMEVYGSDGETIGEVGDISYGVEMAEGGGQLVAQERGYFRLVRPLGPDLYIPSDHIEEVTTDRVTLTHASDSPELDRLAERQEPPGQEG